MQIAESAYPRPSQLPLPCHEDQQPPPAPPQFSLAQPLSPVLEPSAEHMQYDPFLGQYQKLQLDQPPSPPLHSSPGLPAQAPMQQQQQQQYPYQTCELPVGALPEPGYAPRPPYPLQPAQQSSAAEADSRRGSEPLGPQPSYEALGLPELPGLFDCEMMETVDPQHSGYVLVN